MTLIRICLAIFLVAMAAYPATVTIDEFDASATTLTFEGLSSLSMIPGVSIENASTASNSTFFGDQAIANLVSFTPDPTFTVVALNFDAPVQAVGAWFGQINNFLNTNAIDITFSVFGVGGTFLESETLTLPTIGFSSPAFLGITSTELIERVEWSSNNTGFFGADNVIYGDLQPQPPVTVPEPADFSMVILGVGLLVGGWRTRTRRLGTTI
jgi:PEP-CTERM motif